MWLSYLTGTKLSEDSRKYGSENTCTSVTTLTKAALSYGRARAQIEKERGDLLKALGTQVWLNSSLFTDNACISRMWMMRWTFGVVYLTVIFFWVSSMGKGCVNLDVLEVKL